ARSTPASWCARSWSASPRCDPRRRQRLRRRRASAERPPVRAAVALRSGRRAGRPAGRRRPLDVARRSPLERGRAGLEAHAGRGPARGARARRRAGAHARARRRARGAGRQEAPRGRRELTLERRGRHVLGPIELWLGDAFGLAARRLEAAPVEVTVLPRVEPVRGAGGAGLTGIARARRGAAEETDVDGIGPYRPGTPASRIHWQALARLGELMERRLVGEAESWPLVV